MKNKPLPKGHKKYETGQRDCFYRDCYNNGIYQIDAGIHYYTRLCEPHYTQMMTALAESEDKGYSAVNTLDNIYGWRLNED